MVASGIRVDLRRKRLAKLHVLGWWTCLSLVVQLTGCAPDPPEPLRIGINSWPGYELIYLAQEKGLFQQRGVPVRLIEFGSLADARRAYEMDKIDGLATTLIEVLMARDATNRDPQIVHVFDCSTGADVIIAPTDINSVSDLDGKRIGVELASLGIFVLSRALEINGMSFAHIKPVSKDQKTMCQDLQAGKLDAVVTYPPESVGLLKDSKLHVIFSSNDIPGEVVDVLALDNRVLRERPALARAFLQAVNDAYEYMEQHQEEACQIMGEREGLSATEFRKLLTEEMTLIKPSEQSNYFGETGKLRPVLEKAQLSLRHFQLISSKSEAIDCLSGAEGIRHD